MIEITTTTEDLLAPAAQTRPLDGQTPWVVRREELQPCTEALANSGLGCSTDCSGC